MASSATGLTEDNTHLAVTVDDWREVTNGISTGLKCNNKHEVELDKLAGRCGDLSTVLTEMLSKLKVKKGGRLWSSSCGVEEYAEGEEDCFD
ncbi:hypothetical protein BDW75DRAFT_196234 [Aspergillus navahoensis]